MNFAEGLKRIYIVLCCIILIIYAGIRFSEFPNKESISPWLTYQLKDAITADWNREAEQEIGKIQGRGQWVIEDAPGRDLSAELYGGQEKGQEIAKKQGRYEIVFDDVKPSEIFGMNCKEGVLPKIETEKVCQKYRLEIEALPWTRAKHVGETFGVIFAIAVGASLLWALMAWVGRGFKKAR